MSRVSKGYFCELNHHVNNLGFPWRRETGKQFGVYVFDKNFYRLALTNNKLGILF
ncbi:unnamed protein product [Nezara viridula]|uniref:Uncharacterized protein n=1 Tax=Nezara viridula TaxID=85310 RepID=A0A9P0H6P0_NEZVI|nr:unnamed protein product [Nezara viridula]